MTTVLPFGGIGCHGEAFDDGFNEGVKMLIVGEDSSGICYIKLNYVKNGEVIERVHGKITGNETETVFEVDHPQEYITVVEGSSREEHRYSPVRVEWESEEPLEDEEKEEYVVDDSVGELQFKTSEGRESKVFGMRGPGSKDFVLKGKSGMKLAGLTGRSGDFLDSIGAHFVTHVEPPIVKLEAVGGDCGDDWDDGVHEGVHKIVVKYKKPFVRSICFEYISECRTSTYQTLDGEIKEGCLEYKTVKGDEHRVDDDFDGAETKEYTIWYGDYIKAVDVFYGKWQWFEGKPVEDKYITFLRFKTNTGSFQVGYREPYYEYHGGNDFCLEKEGHKVVGFHGKSGYALQKIGAYVKPISL